MENINFAEIFNILKNVVPEKWSNIVFYAQYSQGSYSMKYYVNDESLEYIDCYKLRGISKSEIIKAFIKIDLELSKSRNRLTDEKKWSVLTFQVDESGNFKAEYEYRDVSENTIQYFEEWKNKYLK